MDNSKRDMGTQWITPRRGGNKVGGGDHHLGGLFHRLQTRNKAVYVSSSITQLSETFKKTGETETSKEAILLGPKIPYSSPTKSLINSSPSPLSTHNRLHLPLHTYLTSVPNSWRKEIDLLESEMRRKIRDRINNQHQKHKSNKKITKQPDPLLRSKVTPTPSVQKLIQVQNEILQDWGTLPESSSKHRVNLSRFDIIHRPLHHLDKGFIKTQKMNLEYKGPRVPKVPSGLELIKGIHKLKDFPRSSEELIIKESISDDESESEDIEELQDNQDQDKKSLLLLGGVDIKLHQNLNKIMEVLDEEEGEFETRDGEDGELETEDQDIGEFEIRDDDDGEFETPNSEDGEFETLDQAIVEFETRDDEDGEYETEDECDTDIGVDPHSTIISTTTGDLHDLMDILGK